MSTVAKDISVELRSKLIGLECWYANAGGKHVGSTFSLAFGERILRGVPLSNAAHSEEYRKYEEYRRRLEEMLNNRLRDLDN